MSIKNCLRSMYLLISGGWVQGKTATWENGESCAIHSYSASCFCLSGALERSRRDRTVETQYWVPRERIVDALGFGGPGEMIQWNDAPGRTKQEVLDRIGTAIDKLENAA